VSLHGLIIEVEFSTGEKDHRDKVVLVSVASCPFFGELDFGVDAFEDSVGDFGPDIVEYP
jgi:hypothetical protein